MHTRRSLYTLLVSLATLVVLGALASSALADDNPDHQAPPDGGAPFAEENGDGGGGVPNDEGFPPAGPDFEIVDCPPFFGEMTEGEEPGSDEDEDFSDFLSTFLQCGFLTVPADRDAPEEGDIRLFVTRFNSAFSDEGEGAPVVLLAGGPGESLVEQMVAAGGFLPFFFPNDVILLEQRGVGFSEPAPDCPELDEVAIASLEDDPTNEELIDAATEGISACKDRLASEGLDTSIFSTEESAADLEALRQSLGYDEWDLYGASYGTRVALTAMRDFPEGIRSVILDAPYPLEANTYTSTPANADRAFSMLFDSCAEDTACDGSYPDLEDTFHEVVDRLNEEPAIVEVRDPLSGEVTEASISGADFTYFVFQSMYSTGLIPLLPSIIMQADEGEFGTFAVIAGYVVAGDQFINLPMHLSVECREDVAFTTREEIASATDDYPYLQPLFESSVLLGEAVVDVCDIWDAGMADESWKEAVTSDIPTLILTGAFDPITPPSWAEQVHDNLSNSFLFTFPNVGHGAMLAEPCASELIFVFLEDPSTEPDSYCTDELSGPSFEQPLGDITMVPFTNEFDGFSGLAPDGWIEVGFSAWMRSEAGLVLLSQSALPDSTADEVLASVVSLYGLEAPPEPSGTCCAGEIEWQLYEMDIAGTLTSLAIAEVEGTAYLVSLEGFATEWDRLHEEVFLPAVEAFTLIAPPADTPVGDINMVPYTNEDAGYTSVVPEGWIEEFPGFHGPNETFNVILSQDVSPWSSIEEWEEAIDDLTGAPDVSVTHIGTCCGGPLEWDVYEMTFAEEARLAVAGAESNGVVYEVSVLLSGDSMEWERLHDEVFVPALDAFAPLNGASTGDFEVSIWWPNDDTTVSGIAPIHAALEDHTIYEYDMYWRADGGELVPMWNKTNHQTPHKKAYIDYHQWTWSEDDDLYDIEVIAIGTDGRELGRSTVSVRHPSD